MCISIQRAVVTTFPSPLEQPTAPMRTPCIGIARLSINNDPLQP